MAVVAEEYLVVLLHFGVETYLAVVVAGQSVLLPHLPRISQPLLLDLQLLQGLLKLVLGLVHKPLPEIQQPIPTGQLGLQDLQLRTDPVQMLQSLPFLLEPQLDFVPQRHIAGMDFLQL